MLGNATGVCTCSSLTRIEQDSWLPPHTARKGVVPPTAAGGALRGSLRLMVALSRSHSVCAAVTGQVLWMVDLCRSAVCCTATHMDVWTCMHADLKRSSRPIPQACSCPAHGGCSCTTTLCGMPQHANPACLASQHRPSDSMPSQPSACQLAPTRLPTGKTTPCRCTSARTYKTAAPTAVTCSQLCVSAGAWLPCCLSDCICWLITG